MQTLPLELSCGLPDRTSFSKDFESFRDYIPKSTDRIFGRVDTNKGEHKFIIFGQTGDDIYPIIFSFDRKGEVIDSLFLILKGCGGADESQIPHSLVSIEKDLSITLTDTTRFIHIPANRSVDDHVVDSTTVTRLLFEVDGNGRFENVTKDVD